MAASNETRIARLERLLADIRPGQEEVLDWHDRLRSHDGLYWLWWIEARHPSVLLASPQCHVTRQSPEYVEALQVWRELRRASFSQSYWSTAGKTLIEGKEGRLTYKHERDPDLPAERETRTLMDLLLASLPRLTFVWASDAVRRPYLESRADDPRLKLRRGFACSLPSLSDRTIKSGMKYGVVELEAISLPDWVLLAKPMGHGDQPDGMKDPQEVLPSPEGRLAYIAWVRMFRQRFPGEIPEGKKLEWD